MSNRMHQRPGSRRHGRRGCCRDRRVAGSREWLAGAVRGCSGGGSACTASKPCLLAAAIEHASAGATVHVGRGRYSGGYVIDKKIRLVADGRVVIDASSSADGTGIHIVGPGGSGSVVQGFVVEKARYEGILVGTSPGDASPQPAPVTDVTLRNNIVVSNNTGRGEPGATGECKSTPPAPRRLRRRHSPRVGEQLDRRAQRRRVQQRRDPAHRRVRPDVAQRRSRKPRDRQSVRVRDRVGGTQSERRRSCEGRCVRQPHREQLARNNGVVTTGAGILLGGGAPGSAVYENTIRNNTVELNGHAGITIHQHVVGNLGGNVIEDNTVGTNNSLGDDDFAAATDMQTTGILVASGSPPGPALPPFLLPSPITGTVIRGNKISGDAIGIWTLNTPGDFSANTFAPDVATPLSSH